jgi:hypothetical protein
VLTVHGGLLVAVGTLVLSGLLSPSGPVDRTALRWHVLLWDVWFLVSLEFPGGLRTAPPL